MRIRRAFNRRSLIVITCVFASIVAYLLWPLSTKRWEIQYDTQRVAKKKEQLETVRKSSEAVDNRPNIVLILADDLGYTDSSIYGKGLVTTPNLEQLATDGVVFTDAYCTASICSPSRAGLLTGRYQQRFGYETQPMTRYPRNRLEYYAYKYLFDTGDWALHDLQGIPRKQDIMKQGLPPSELNLAELMKACGYRTGIVGKWHLGYSEELLPNNVGFDYQYGFYEAFTLYAPIDAEGIVNFRHDYFASRHIWAQERKGPCAIRRNGVVVEEKEYLTFAIAREAREFIRRNVERPFFLFASFSAPHTPFQAPRKYVDRFPGEPDMNRRVYKAMIAALDDAVGEVLKEIDEAGLGEKTVVFFASDNGGATYTGATDNGHLKGGKFTNFEGGIRIPLAVRWPKKIKPGIVVSTPVILPDVFVTAAKASGCELPADVKYDGVDLMPVIDRTGDLAADRMLFWRSGTQKAVRHGPWKLLLDNKTGRTHLYDLQRDMGETNDLSTSERGVHRRLMESLQKWEETLKKPLWPEVMYYRFRIDGIDYDFPL